MSNAVSLPPTAYDSKSNSSIGNDLNSNDMNGANSNEDDRNRMVDVQWAMCKGPVAVDYIPCLDNWKAIKALP